MNEPVTEALVSTIIPVYNRAAMIRAAVQSVLNQTYRPIEIILVDDGSTDETPVVLRELRDSHPDEIRLIFKENDGPGLAREQGRLVARGEFIQYLDSDDWLLPDKFQVQVDALRAHPDCDIAYGITRLVDSEGEILNEQSKATGTAREFLFPALLVDRWWHTHTPLYTRRISDLSGAWSKQRPEDWDLEARMGVVRPKLVYCSQAVSCHRHHESENRVTRWNHDAYLKDEAWFLPRLYDCAVQAGVPPGTPEMHHFSRWAFAHARRAARAGDGAGAQRFVDLSCRADPGSAPERAFFLWLARWVGWRTAASLLQAGRRTLAGLGLLPRREI